MEKNIDHSLIPDENFKESEKFSTTYAIGSFFLPTFYENFKFLKNCPYDFHEILHNHSTSKGAPVWAMASKLYDWNVRNIAKNSHFSIFSKTVHTIRTKFCRVILHHIMILCVQFYQIRMTGIRASQKEKDLIRLFYRICGSGNYCFSSKSNVRLCVIQISKFHVHRKIGTRL